MWLGWAGIAVNCGFGFSRKLVGATDTLPLLAYCLVVGRWVVILEAFLIHHSVDQVCQVLGLTLKPLHH